MLIFIILFTVCLFIKYLTMMYERDQRELIRVGLILIIIWILAYMLTHVSGEATTWDTWRVNTGDDVSMEWNIVCDTEFIYSALKRRIYPTTYNLFDNTGACRIVYGDRYIDTEEGIEDVANAIARNNIYTLLISSETLNQYYVLHPDKLYQTKLLIEGIIQQLASYYIKHVK